MGNRGSSRVDIRRHGTLPAVSRRATLSAAGREAENEVDQVRTLIGDRGRSRRDRGNDGAHAETPEAAEPQTGRLVVAVGAPRIDGWLRNRILVLDASGHTLASGPRVRVGRSSPSYRLPTVSAPAVPGTSVRLRLKLLRKAFVAVWSALKRRKRVSTKIKIRATDSAGNTKQEQRTVRLRM